MIMKSASIFILSIAMIATAASGRKRSELSDSLEYELRNDYLICTDDTTTLSKDQLIEWKSEIDSATKGEQYQKLFKEYQAFTGLKAEDIRPCQPISWSNQLEQQLYEMDSIITAQRKIREKIYKDSVVKEETSKLEESPADLFGIPAGVSRKAFRWLFSQNGNGKLVNTPHYIRADSVVLDSVTLTAAFHFDQKGKYKGYELETAALEADSLDSTVRSWMNRMAETYTEITGKKPKYEHEVGSEKIKEGRLSVCKQWSEPSILIGLATYKQRYYAKVMVKY